MVIDYLLKKYLFYFYRISLTPSKKTLTATYQPKRKNYQIKKNPYSATYWGTFFELRFLLGFSIIFMIRILLDWGNSRRTNSFHTNYNKNKHNIRGSTNSIQNPVWE